MSDSALKKAAIALSSLDAALPVSFKRLFYRLPFALLKKRLESEAFKGELWLRNSVYFDEMVFPMSDIDLSFFFSEKMSSVRIKALDKILKKWRYFFPHLGEMACFDLDGLETFSRYANKYEIARDPRLLEKLEALTLGCSQSGYACDIAFLLRWFQSDLDQLKSTFKGRAKKTKRFLKLLDKADLPFSDLESLCKGLLSHPENSLALKSDEKAFLRHQLNHINESILPENEEDLRRLLVFFPHLWVGLPLEKRSLFIDDLSARERMICCAQIEWEIWGLYTQVVRVKNIGDNMIHIESLKALVERIEEPYLVEGLIQLENYCMTFWYEDQAK